MGEGERMGTSGRLRVDARRNRELIIDTARRIFTEQGAGATMDEVAKQAGLGPGTLYRHFPDRDSLFQAVVEDGLQRMIALADAARAEESSSWDALSRFMRGCAGLRLDLLGSMARAQADRMTANPEIQQGRARLMDVLDGIVTDAHREGTMRRDVGTGDVLGVVSLLIRGLPTLSPDLAGDFRDRTLELILVGMRNHPWAPSLGEAMGAEALSRRLAD
ncbi:TetR/AcrR family transcriptional regulator [Streptosporangium sp. NBC_01639]|uniref:TetR/AcrR family transcriptional regulator n=1 Tax=Streptosporangium sp. NBC_01639 TaxID=2975948 RepID=UPI003865E124|nr:TetR/AcrR family transcriptional regulator [Streptosporangium sp. NBC_01639]